VAAVAAVAAVGKLIKNKKGGSEYWEPPVY